MNQEFKIKSIKKPLFPALMSDTFQRVFDNAAEVALLERATIICNIESSLPDNRKRKFLR